MAFNKKGDVASMSFTYWTILRDSGGPMYFIYKLKIMTKLSRLLLPAAILGSLI